MLKFESLEDAMNCYGRNNLVPIDNLKQIIFYTKQGCQPKFLWENENKSGKITCWYLKCETNVVYSIWLKHNEKKPRESV